MPPALNQTRAVFIAVEAGNVNCMAGRKTDLAAMSMPRKLEIDTDIGRKSLCQIGVMRKQYPRDFRRNVLECLIWRNSAMPQIADAANGEQGAAAL